MAEPHNAKRPCKPWLSGNLESPMSWFSSPSRMPRDMRDTLFLVAVIAWTLAPHAAWLAPSLSGLCAVVLVWRALLAWTQRPLPGRWALLGVLVAGTAIVWWEQKTLFGRDAGVTLLVLLMTLKTLELRARRDAMVVFFLGFFLILTQFFYSQSLIVTVSMGLAVWGWLTALSLAHMPAGYPSLWQAGRIAGWAAMIGTPVMVALFVLFPRISPLWAMPNDQGFTGLSDEMGLGDITQLAQDRSIAARLRFPEGAPPREPLYLRGPVLTHYDGQRWLTLPQAAPLTTWAPPPGTTPVRYEITLEPLRLALLPLPEHTLQRPEGLPLQGDWPSHPDRWGQWRLPAPAAQRFRLRGEAWPRFVQLEPLSPLWHRTFTATPSKRHPRTRAWADALAQRPDLQGASASQRAQAVLTHIRTGGYGYTLSPGALGPDPVDTFWLDQRRGFCEHYAASVTLILRMMGVPARIVTGYLGTDPQPVDGYYIVRQSNAHAWVEYWEQGHGWIRLDPTAAVDPNRVETGQALSPPPTAMGRMMGTWYTDWLLQSRLWFEILDNRWNQWILGYGALQQNDLLQHLGWEGDTLLGLAQILLGLVCASALGGALWAWWDGRRRTPWERLRTLILDRLQQLNVAAQPHHSPAQLADLLTARHGSAAQELVAHFRALEQLRYAQGSDSTASASPPSVALRAWQRQFMDAVRRLRTQTL